MVNGGVQGRCLTAQGSLIGMQADISVILHSMKENEKEVSFMSEQEKKELDHIARVFEKFLYGKLIKREGKRAEGLRVVWIDDDGKPAK